MTVEKRILELMAGENQTERREQDVEKAEDGGEQEE